MTFLDSLEKSSPKLMTITMDSREPKYLMETIGQAIDSVNKRARSDRENINYNIKTAELFVGDYTDGHIVVERKTVDDFIASIKDGRINSMLAKLVQDPVPLYMLISGDVKMLDNIQQKAYSTTCAKLMKVGISVISLPSDFILMHCMVRLFQFGMKNKNVEYKIDRPYPEIEDDQSKTVTMRMLLSIPGMIETKAAKLAKFSLIELGKKTLQELSDLIYAGTGKPPKKPTKTAYKVFLALRNSFESYAGEGEEDKETEAAATTSKVDETHESLEEIEEGEDEYVPYSKIFSDEKATEKKGDKK